LHKKLLIPNQEAGLSQEEIEAGFGTAGADDGWAGNDKKTETAQKADDGWGTPAPAVEDDGWGTPAPKKKTEEVAVNAASADTAAVDDFEQQMTMATDEEFFADQLSVIEVKEDWVFDKKR